MISPADKAKAEAALPFDAAAMVPIALPHILAESAISTSFLQRRFRLGYNKALLVLAELQKAGHVSTALFNGRYEVLAQQEAGKPVAAMLPEELASYQVEAGTPLTDAAEAQVKGEYQELPVTDVARQLERELIASQAREISLRAALEMFRPLCSRDGCSNGATHCQPWTDGQYFCALHADDESAEPSNHAAIVALSQPVPAAVSKSDFERVAASFGGAMMVFGQIARSIEKGEATVESIAETIRVATMEKAPAVVPLAEAEAVADALEELIKGGAITDRVLIDYVLNPRLKAFHAKRPRPQ